MTALRFGLAVALVLMGCATGTVRSRRDSLPPPANQSRAGASARNAGPAPVLSRERARAAPQPPQVERAIGAASSLVGQRSIVVDGVDYGPGCAALVRAAFAQAGRPLPPDVRDARSVMDLAGRRGAVTTTRRPAPGDLVFLADEPGGAVSHVALVARAEPDGTFLAVHRVERGVRRVRMNLSYPARATDPATGKLINDTLVVRKSPLPAGSLVVAVSDLLRRG
jgi:cell wall-associated NlpC family hydrolase